MGVLYELIYPCTQMSGINEMYMNGNNYRINQIEKEVHIYNYGQINFDTYYNSFSIEKWHKYTKLDTLFLNVEVKGKCKITVYNKYLTAGDYLCKIVHSQNVCFDEYTNVVIELSDFMTNQGILALEILALEESCYFKKGYYSTDTEQKRVKIGIGICTYKREAYIERYVQSFKEYNKETLGLFIADNGGTLKINSSENLYIFKNKNYGGAGGFGRCMYEIKKYNENNENTYTHIVLMDDDLFIDFSIFDKMRAFLSLIKKKYQMYFLAGAMCSMDYPFLQYEKYSGWTGRGFIQMAPNYDLRDCNTIITNEREEKLAKSSAGWWCSCFSTKMLTANNYPFPCFFRGDDMEYTIRNGSNVITLNGINVWHEPFYKKYSIISENYYLMRNLLVINSLYYPRMNWKNSSRLLYERFRKAILTYDYKGAEMIIKAIEDYSKGVDFFENVDPEKLNKKLLSKNYKMEKLENLVEEFRFDDINHDLYFTRDKNRLTRLIRLVTLNGYLIPKIFYRGFSFSHVGFGAYTINYYKTKRVLSFDPFTKTGYFVDVSKKKAFLLVMKYLKVNRKMKKEHEKIKNDYQCNFWKLQTESFWKKYLGV